MGGGGRTDFPRAYHGQFPYGLSTGGTRTETDEARATHGLRRRSPYHNKLLTELAALPTL